MTADNELKNFTLIPNVENGGRKCGSSNINLAMENSVCIKLKSENMREREKAQGDSSVLFNMATNLQLGYKSQFIY